MGSKLAYSLVLPLQYWRKRSTTSSRRGLIALGSLLALPFVVAGAIELVSLERTPVTGRIRAIAFSVEDESKLIAEVLGESYAECARSGRADEAWAGALRRQLMLNERSTLLGHRILPATDERVERVEAVLRILEAGAASMCEQGATAEAGDLRLPPLRYPLRPRDGSDALLPRYSLIVLDSPEDNAFSFGFGPREDSAGVIVVYSGALDKIFGQPQRKPRPDSIFGVLRPSVPQSRLSEPTRDQAEQLAVLLAHELSHLLCSHQLETKARDHLGSEVRALCADSLTSKAVRVLFWPLTFILGPFFNDFLAEYAKRVSAVQSDNIASACESRKHELEADAVSLRILAHAKINPTAAESYWRSRLASSSSPSHPGWPVGLRMHSTTPEEARETFTATHPTDAARLEAIQATLRSWARWSAAQPATPQIEH